MRILIVPETAKTHGTGHLRRSIQLALELQTLHDQHVDLLLPDSFSPDRLASLLSETADSAQTKDHFHRVSIDMVSEKRRYDLVVIDGFRTAASTLELFLGKIPVVGLDEGGENRGSFDFLIDILIRPGTKGLDAANICTRAFLKLPNRRRTFPERIRSVLVSFGGEDPGKLSSEALRLLLKSPAFCGCRIRVLRPSLIKELVIPNGVEILEPIPNLKERLAEYDLVVTSYGLTAFEAMGAGLPVLILDPTPYHRSLTRSEGLAGIGLRRPSARKAERYMKNLSLLKSITDKHAPKPSSLSDTITALADRLLPNHCPVCASTRNAALDRFPTHTFFRCRVCGTVYKNSKSSRSYEKEYFFSEYEHQYGKTYLEDFPSIRKMARSRLDVIAGLRGESGTTGSSLLDVGCAYGAFLVEAKEAGYITTGLDISESAVAYIHAQGWGKALSTDFLAYNALNTRFDVITMWYVIEHFSDSSTVFEKCRSLLAEGGLLCLSTPNLDGISGRKDRHEFLNRSPDDHRVVFSPRSAARALRLHGFSPLRVVVTGHHPERFPGVTAASSRWLKNVVGCASRVLGLGDTFEIYAVKTRNRE